MAPDVDVTKFRLFREVNPALVARRLRNSDRAASAMFPVRRALDLRERA